MLRNEKQQSIESLRGKFEKATSAVFVDFTGLDVPTVTALRDTFRAAQVEYRVVKNKLTKLAVKDQPWAGSLGKTLTGATGVAFSYEEPSAAAKVLKEFVKAHEKLKIKGGVVEGNLIDGRAVVEQLATMPGKNELRAQLLATFAAPLTQFVQQLCAPAQNFVYALKAKQDKG